MTEQEKQAVRLLLDAFTKLSEARVKGLDEYVELLSEIERGEIPSADTTRRRLEDAAAERTIIAGWSYQYDQLRAKLGV